MRSLLLYYNLNQEPYISNKNFPRFNYIEPGEETMAAPMEEHICELLNYHREDNADYNRYDCIKGRTCSDCNKELKITSRTPVHIRPQALAWLGHGWRWREVRPIWPLQPALPLLKLSPIVLECIRQ